VADENGSVVSSIYDAAGRLTGRSVQRAAGIIGTTEQSFSYDAAGRMASSTDNNDPGGGTTVGSFGYDYDAAGHRSRRGGGRCWPKAGTPSEARARSHAKRNKLYQEDLRDSQLSELYAHDQRDRLTSCTGAKGTYHRKH
jgi:hypothetical protein